MPPMTTAAPERCSLRFDVIEALCLVCTQIAPRKRYGAAAFEKYARTMLGRVCGGQAGTLHDEQQYQLALLFVLEAYDE